MKKKRESLENDAMLGLTMNISVMGIENMMTGNTSIPFGVSCVLCLFVCLCICLCVVITLYKRSTVFHLEVDNTILLTIGTML